MAKTPVKYNRALCVQICERVADGEPGGLRSILGSPGMPSRMSWFNWVAKHAWLRELYELAMAVRWQLRVDEADEIADAAPQRVELRIGDDVTETRVDPGFEQWRRTRLDQIKWRASHELPKKYGDKVKLADADGGSIGAAFAAAMTAALKADPRGDGDRDG